MATKRQFCICLYSLILVLIAVTTLNLLVTKFFGKSPEEDMSGKYFSIDFEVFGRVQGVFFRKHTQKKGQELNLVGWCMNTSRDTVVGHLQGDRDKVEEMKLWLQTKGSPSSKIDRAVFTNEKPLNDLTFKSFDIRK